MIKAELTELKKLYTQKNCSVSRICGCYVDGDKNKKAQFARSFLGLPEEEMFKYFEIFRKALSGTPGKNCIDLEFLQESVREDAGGIQTPQDFLLALRDSKLKDEDLLYEYFNRIISSFEYVGNYLILVVADAYDVPGRAMDGAEMEDASDEIYEYLLTVICPVNLTEPGLSFNAETGEFHNRVRDWVVELPMTGFLFPAFNDRTADIHSVLYYSKDAENLNESFIELMLGCAQPMSAGAQKETFQALVEETLGETCQFEAVKNIHEKMGELIEEHREELTPLMLDRGELKGLFASSGVDNAHMAEFEQHYEAAAGDSAPLMVSNVYNPRSFDIKTPDVVIKVKPDRTDLIDERTVDGRPCLVVELGGEVVVNGIQVKSGRRTEEDE
ncbi:MAG: DUF4317 domain-containing protein [Lachnospiraceae bacterium]|nr:DUF4317 domain-containing protein [Lachnospiraceae bacterium]